MHIIDDLSRGFLAKRSPGVEGPGMSTDRRTPPRSELRLDPPPGNGWNLWEIWHLHRHGCEKHRRI
jgi:hypothetical protein